MDKVCLGLEWAEPLDHAMMREISSSVSGKALLLPRKIEFSSGSVAKTEADELPDVLKESDSELMGIIFDDNTEKDSPVEQKNIELLIKPDGLLFTVQNSVGEWGETRERAKEVISSVFSIIRKYREFESIGLLVSNGFEIADDDLPVSQILNFESEYLPKKIFSSKDYWKLDNDYFWSEESGRFNSNVEVSLTPTEEGRTLAIMTLQRLLPLADPLDDIDVVFSHFEILYKKNVSLIQSFIHTDVCELIGMTNSRE
ncbi:hypothetical protein IV02_27135 [Pseudomonas syringae]|uniref:TIGR04255 family protein n=2 Tax=Pseudomonas syringae TaxID=317 RepID=A0A085UQN2_PSESX|nr:hypothetical protein IV02_27135 [Pseudomonas syringae]